MKNILNQAVTKPQRSKALRQLGDNKRSLASTVTLPCIAWGNHLVVSWVSDKLGANFNNYANKITSSGAIDIWTGIIDYSGYNTAPMTTNEAMKINLDNDDYKVAAVTVGLCDGGLNYGNDDYAYYDDSKNVVRYRTQTDYQVDREGHSSITDNNKNTADELKIYPNPANNQLAVMVSLSNHELITKIEITDLLGRTLVAQSSSLNAQSQTFDVSNFENGIYIIHVSTDSKTITEKFVVQH